MTPPRPAKDRRSYSRIDDGYLDNPKVYHLVEDSPRAVLLHVAAINYASRHLTDGAFPARRVAASACASVCQPHCEGQCQPQCDLGKLLQCGLVDLLDDGTYAVHDYTHYNRTAVEVKIASSAGQRNARKRWSDRDAQATDANGNADGTANRNAKREREREQLLREAPNVEIDTPDVETKPREQARRKTAKKTKPTADLPHGFADFWTAWPRKNNKPAAVRAWKTATQRATPETIRAGLEAQLPELLTRESRYRPMASNWLNNDRWEDEPTEMSRQARRAQSEDAEAAAQWAPRVERTEAETAAHEAATLERIAARNAASRAEEEAHNERANGIADLKAANLWPRRPDGTWNNDFTPAQIDDLIRNAPRKVPAAAL